MDPRRALSFGSAAQAYADARPTYPVDAVRFALPPDAQEVLDLGAGTGKLTGVLLDLGLDVIAVEPDDAMRAHIDPRADCRSGTAELVPVDDGSVDAVLVGQAWHWFDHEAAMSSVRRVLRPGGSLGLLWNVLDDTSGWAAEIIELLHLEDRLSLTSKDPHRSEGDEDGFTPWERELVVNPQRGDADLFITNLTSRSLVILMEEPARSELLEQVRTIVPSGDFDIPWVTEAWRATKL